jgi:ribosomal protein L44E
MPEKMTIECPFCNKQTIQILHSPEVYSTQTIRVGSNRKTIPNLTPAKDQVLTLKCPNCGKSKKEIEYALIHGKELSREEVVRRLKEAGLDPSKLK